MPETTLERVTRVIAATQHFSPEKASTITGESTFQELGIDSLDGINVVFALENEFDISVPDDAAKSMRGVRDIVSGIDVLLTAKAEPAG
ncbi:MAG TPA: phosphopantetheine-binding protein [Bryobacteraceae bacterium]|nr:phosphopantetheine-binding protein [Bryobacteraceae bacterium]